MKLAHFDLFSENFVKMFFRSSLGIKSKLSWKHTAQGKILMTVPKNFCEINLFISKYLISRNIRWKYKITLESKAFLHFLQQKFREIKLFLISIFFTKLIQITVKFLFFRSVLSQLFSKHSVKSTFLFWKCRGIIS